MAALAPHPSRDSHEAGTSDVRRPGLFTLADLRVAVGDGLVARKFELRNFLFGNDLIRMVFPDLR